jgi:plastocyanin
MHLRIALVVAVLAALIVPSVAGARLYGRVGPGPSISLKRANGTLVRHLEPGGKVIVVRDRATNHNFHLKGPGVDRKTGVAFTGRRTWSVQFVSGTYRYICDVHPTAMRKTFTVG